MLISPDDLAGLEETIAVLGDTDVLRGLQVAEAAVAAGDVVRGVGAVRIVYRIDDSRHEVIVLRVDHGRDVYRA